MSGSTFFSPGTTCPARSFVDSYKFFGVGIVRTPGGPGLGLSIAKELVDRHRGRLELVDKEGPGLAVRLTLWIEGPDHG